MKNKGKKSITLFYLTTHVNVFTTSCCSLLNILFLLLSFIPFSFMKTTIKGNANINKRQNNGKYSTFCWLFFSLLIFRGFVSHVLHFIWFDISSNGRLGKRPNQINFLTRVKTFMYTKRSVGVKKINKKK